MFPSLQIASPSLVAQVINEAKRILSEVGMEIRGHALHKLLLERGLLEDPKTKRLLFPIDVIDRASPRHPAA